MIRTTSRPPTGKCTLSMYMGYLMSSAKSANCTDLAYVMNLSHDSVNRFLLRECYEPEDLFNEAKKLLNIVGGVLHVDDTTLDKPYSQHMDLVGHFWSGKHHKVVKGLNLITLYYTDPQGRGLPVNYRLYDKTEGKTKNDYFCDMLKEVLDWGLKPIASTGDSWYSCKENLKAVKKHQMSFLFAIESNRRVSVKKGTWTQVQQLDVPTQGMMVYLREFGEVKLFRTMLKNQQRHYIVFLNNNDYDAFDENQFQCWHDQHWEIEQYHRMLKQVCNIEKFQVRRQTPIRNHIFAALCSYVQLQQMQFTALITNAYRWQRDLYKDIIASFIGEFMAGKEYFEPQFQKAVNA